MYVQIKQNVCKGNNTLYSLDVTVHILKLKFQENVSISSPAL